MTHDRAAEQQKRSSNRMQRLTSGRKVQGQGAGHLCVMTRSLMAASMMRVREAMTTIARVTGPTCAARPAHGAGARGRG